jgi:hypothetical protein
VASDPSLPAAQSLPMGTSRARALGAESLVTRRLRTDPVRSHSDVAASLGP